MENGYEVLILAANKAQLNTAYKLYKKFLFQGKKTLIITEHGSVNTANNYDLKTLAFYQGILNKSYYPIRQQAYNFFYSIAEQEIYPGKTLRDLTKYKGVSLWDLSVKYVFSELIPTMYYINIINGILDREKPGQVHLINNSSNLENIFIQICKKEKISCIIHKKSLPDFKQIPVFIKKIKKFILSSYFLLLNLRKSLLINKRYPVVFFAPVERFLISMLPVVKKYSEKERLLINAPNSDASKILKENCIFYMDFYGYKLFDLFALANRSLLGKIRNVFRDSVFTEKLIYEGLSLSPALQAMFDRLISEEFPEKIREVDIVRKILLSYKPEVIVVASYSYDVILIAKTLFIPSVAIQSGHVSEFYHFSPARADILAIDGIYWQEFLLKQGVEAARIQVTGDPRYEILPEDITIQKDLNLEISKKIIVFACTYTSVAMGVNEDEKIRGLKAVCNAVKNIKDIHLIIKLHPYETCVDRYKSIAKELNLINYTIVNNVHMLKLLKIYDLLITQASGAGYEAVLMDKDVIVLNLDSDFCADDVWNFRRYNAVMFVERLEDLRGAIEKVFFDSETSSRLKRNRNEYIPLHAYKMDGKASERVKNVIDKFINITED